MGCQKNSITESELGSTIGIPNADLVTSMNGIVLDQDGKPLEGAIINAENIEVVSDEYGFFEIDEIETNENGLYFTVNKSGYYNTFKFVMPIENQKAHTRIRMVERNLTGAFNSNEEGNFTLNDGATIAFTPNSIIDAAGNDFVGQVNVYGYYFNPEDTRLQEEMPGDLRAVNNDNELLQLGTYGMMLVELTTSSGEKLNVKPSSPATAEFPLSAVLVSKAPQTIPLWSFNEVSGFWEQENEASLVGNKYVAKLNHFSFWNCDAPFPVVEIDICFRDENGIPIPNLLIKICAEDVVGVGYGYTSNYGCVTGKIPKDKLLTIKLEDQCGDKILLENIGPFSESVDLEVVTISQSDYLYNLSGQLIGCMMEPLKNAYLVVNTGDDFIIIDADEEGYFNQTVSNCDQMEFRIVGYDRDNFLSTNEIVIPVGNNTSIDLEQIEVCDNQIDEFILLSVGSNPEVLIENPDAYLVDGVDTYFEGFKDGLSTYLKVSLNGNTPGGTIVDKVLGRDGDVDFICLNNCTTFNVNLDADAVVDEYITGSFDGEVNSFGNPVSVTGTFRILVEAAQSSSISGRTFHDENGNNINDGEIQIEDIEFRLIDDANNLHEIATADANGAYTFSNIIPGDYRVLINDSLSFVFSDKDFGGDDTVDSDFGSDGYTDVITLTPSGNQYENVDLGIKTTVMDCNAFGKGCGNDCTLWLDVTGGLEPYTFNWDHGFTEQNPPCFGGGVYQVTITDALGGECITEAFVDDVPATIEGVLWIDNDNGMDGIRDQANDLLSMVDTVRLFDINDNEVAWSAINQNGFYNFFVDAWNPNEGYVKFDLPAGYEFVPQDQGPNENLDSDVNEEGKTPIFTIEPCFYYRFDAGIRLQ